MTDKPHNRLPQDAGFLARSTTERPSPHGNLHRRSLKELLELLNLEDWTVPCAIRKALPQIVRLAEAIYQCLRRGGRLFYIGTGTSGRLGVLDAAEIPPTFGVPPGRVIGVIAGGDSALRGPVEFAEDDPLAGWKDLLQYQISTSDFVVGISASGRTPYTVGAIQEARKHRIATGCITVNAKSPLAEACEYPVIVDVGPEVVSGSTRLKAGTAQKMVLNMISTAVFIRLGHVHDRFMLDLRPLNQKLLWRGTRIIQYYTGVSEEEARNTFLRMGSVRKAIEWIRKHSPKSSYS